MVEGRRGGGAVAVGGLLVVAEELLFSSGAYVGPFAERVTVPIDPVALIFLGGTAMIVGGSLQLLTLDAD